MAQGVPVSEPGDVEIIENPDCRLGLIHTVFPRRPKISAQAFEIADALGAGGFQLPRHGADQRFG
ncbi:MAG: hypothetical protein E5X69_06360, partial [Mesorhizobium sp.]